MIAEYSEKIFINPAFEYGIRNYLSYKEEGTYSKPHTFEMHVIKALTIIYGESSIILPYNIFNERAFKCNLLMYDFKENDMELFIKYMNDYYMYMKNIKNATKPTDLIARIEYLLIDMINRRARKHPFSDEELADFDTIFNPINGNLKQLKKLVSTNEGLIINEWNNRRSELSNTMIRMMAVNPNLLSPDMYAKYGYDIQNVANLPANQIDEVNNRVIEAETLANQTPYKPEKIPFYRRVVLTSGSGFVDKLMLLSIVATEIMIGLVIAINM